MKEKNTETPKQKALFPGLIDLVQGDDGAEFFKKNDDGSVGFAKEHLVSGVKVIPPAGISNYWLLPRADEVTKYSKAQRENPEEAYRELFHDLVTHLKAAAEMPTEDHYDALAAWIFHTYLLESFTYSPIILFVGPSERGKSRMGEAMIFASYRGIALTLLREPTLRRMSDYFEASLFIDLTDFWGTAMPNMARDVVLARFGRGPKSIAVMHPEKGPYKDMAVFKNFGPTIIATNKETEWVLGSRAITIRPPAAKREFPNDVVEEAALPLRERLVAFRARNLGNPMPAVDKPSPHRLGDILTPLYQIIRFIDEDREAGFLEFARELQLNRLAEKLETTDGRILKVVLAYETRMKNGKIPVTEITEIINHGATGNHRISSSKVGKVLKSWGLEDTNLPGTGRSAYFWNNEKIDELKGQYGLNGEDA